MMETERLVIGKLIYDPMYRIEALQYLKPKDFVDEDYRKVVSGLNESIAQNRAVDALEFIERYGVDSIPTEKELEGNIDFVAAYQRIAKEGNRFRTKVLVNNWLANTEKEGFDWELETSKLAESLQKPVEANYESKYGANATEEFFLNLGKGSAKVGATGIQGLDNILEGLEQGQIYSIVAAPGVGKSMFGIQIFEESMKLGTTCLYLSNEMNQKEIIARMVARRTGLSSKLIRSYNKLYDHSKEQVSAEVQNIHELFDQTKSLVIDGSHNYVEAYKDMKFWIAKENVKLIVIDHLHNFSGQKEMYDRISHIAHSLQSLAHNMNVAIVILAQLSKDNRFATNVEAITAKGAMDVEEVSNVMIALSRARVQIQGSEEQTDPTKMTITITKNREGGTGVVGCIVKFPSMVIVQKHE